MREIIETTNAPAAIGNYSQAVVSGDTIYLSGQIPLDPVSMTLVEGDAKVQVKRIFENIKAVVTAAACRMDDIVKLTVYLVDLAMMPAVNEVIAEYFAKPYPARTSIQVSALPKGAVVEVDAVLCKK